MAHRIGHPVERPGRQHRPRLAADLDHSADTAHVSPPSSVEVSRRSRRPWPAPQRFAEPAHHPGRHADRHPVVGHALEDDRVRADHRAAADRDARAHDDVLAEPRAVADIDRRHPGDALCEHGPGRVGERVLVVGDVHVAGQEHLAASRTERTAEITQAPTMLVPSPIVSATSPPLPASTCSHEPGPT